MKDCRKGKLEARRALYNMYAPQMLSVCHRYAKNSEDAKDIFQQGFYLIYKNIGQLRDEKALSGWVKRIFVNLALQYYKRNSTMHVVDDFTQPGLDVGEAFDPLSKMAENEIIELIQKLPHGCREVFNLYAIDGFSHKEIAEQLEISVGTSKSQLHSARKMLQKAILKNKNYKATKGTI